MTDTERIAEIRNEAKDFTPPWDDVIELCDEFEELKAELTKHKAAADGFGSMLKSVQQDCIDVTKELTKHKAVVESVKKERSIAETALQEAQKVIATYRDALTKHKVVVERAKKLRDYDMSDSQWDYIFEPLGE